MSHHFALYFPTTSQLFEVNGAPHLVVGNSAICELNLADFLPPAALRGVSRRHCKIALVEGQGYTLEDLSSRNGTWLNGQRLTPGSAILLNDGDLLTLAQHANFTIEICGGGGPRRAPALEAQPSAGVLHRGPDGQYWVNGYPMPYGALTPKEHQLLDYLFERSGRICLYDDLARDVWGDDETPVQNNTISKCLSSLRHKLDQRAQGAGKRHIQTVHGRGITCVPVLTNGTS